MKLFVKTKSNDLQSSLISCLREQICYINIQKLESFLNDASEEIAGTDLPLFENSYSVVLVHISTTVKQLYRNICTDWDFKYENTTVYMELPQIENLRIESTATDQLVSSIKLSNVSVGELLDSQTFINHYTLGSKNQIKYKKLSLNKERRFLEIIGESLESEVTYNIRIKFQILTHCFYMSAHEEFINVYFILKSAPMVNNFLLFKIKFNLNSNQTKCLFDIIDV